MAKKDFKKNPAELFISTADEPQAAPAAPAQDGAFIPKGYKLVKEPKSARLQLLVRPLTKEGIKRAAEAQGLSMNDLINQILDEYIERQGIE